jgi:hypothetical protein
MTYLYLETLFKLTSKVVGLEPTTLILETKVLPIKLYLYSTFYI